MAATFDAIIRGGSIVDGTGSEPVDGDVAISNGRITAIGRVSGSATEEIDARGRLITPGFVDIHTHYDGQAIWSSRLTPSSLHGVTTVVAGNCGVGFAPCRSADRELLVGLMEGVEDIPGAVMAEGLTWGWETFPEFLDVLEQHHHDIDMGVYLPHSPLRVYVMGQRGANREPATTDDLAHMRSLAGEAMQAGAIGFASSRAFLHRTKNGDPIPSFGVADAEYRAIGAGLRHAGHGIIQVSMDAPRTSFGEEIEWLRQLALDSGLPTTFSFGAPNERSDEWKGFLAQIARANREGVSVTAQIFPRPIGMILGFDLSVNPFCLCESYQPLKALPLAERISELRRPEIRGRLLTEPAGPSPSLLTKVGRMFEYMFQVADSPDYEPDPDSSIAAQARRRGVTPESLAYDLLLERNGRAMLAVWMGNYQSGSLDYVHDLLGSENIVLGLGDGGAHYGMLCDASYPTYLLAYWTRDRRGKRLSIGHAVKSLAADPAKTVGFLDRGILAPGYKADINVIDYGRLSLPAPEVSYDLPAGGRRLNQRANGFELTMVAGRITYRNGEPTGELPGRLVRGAQRRPH